MKSPKIKFIVILAIALASTVGILVLAQSPTPTPKPEDFPFHLVMKCAPVHKDKLLNALTTERRPKDTYKFQYQRHASSPIEDLGEGELSIPTATPCPIDRFVGNATQRAAFAKTQELKKFLKKAGL